MHQQIFNFIISFLQICKTKTFYTTATIHSKKQIIHMINHVQMVHTNHC